MTSDLPILVSEFTMPRIIEAYCNRCKRVTDHIIYREYDKLYIRCSSPRCNKEIYAGNRAILAFETIYCEECERETLWVIYCDYEKIYLKCIGCGSYVYAGNTCPVK